MTKPRFAAIGINHAHIYGQVDCLLRAGAELVGFHAPEDDLAKAFAERYPQAPRAADRARLLEDKTIPLIVSAGIPPPASPPTAPRSASRRCATARIL
jgi:predicted dehydrogenase